MAQTVVITGSTRGIGYGLAQAFLQRGCNVLVNGRSPAAVAQAVAALGAQTGAADRVAGHAADVTDYAQVEGLWEAARASFGRVDIWINNAGLAHPDNVPLWEQPPEMMREVVALNLLGALYGLRVAARAMAAQGGGTIYDLEGFGSNGRVRPGLGLYGATKAAIRFVAKALTADAGVWKPPVRFGTISPGIVITDLVTSQYAGRPEAFASAKRVFNILGDRVETVTPHLVDQVLAGRLTIEWLTPPKVFWRFLTAGFNKRNLFDPAA